jgi:hypothetical protein
MSVLKRYTTLPLSLYRIQARLPVSLRSYANRTGTSYDLKTTEDGLVLPMAGDVFHTPNGMSLRPSTPRMHEILRGFKGSPTVFMLHEGLTLPKGLVVLHEHTDHYSLQTALPIPLDEFNGKLTEFLKGLSSVSKEQFLKSIEDEDDQDN